MSSELQVLILSMAPISELRGAIPVGIAVLGLPSWEVFLISVLGNLIPVVFLLLFFDKFAKIASKKFPVINSFLNRIFANTRLKFAPWIKKYGNTALTLFVAVPLPLTGGWTGAIAAFLFALPFKTAFPLIAVGVLIAGGIVSAFTIGGVAVEEYFGWQSLLGTILFLLFLWVIYRFFRRKSKITSF